MISRGKEKQTTELHIPRLLPFLQLQGERSRRLDDVQTNMAALSTVRCLLRSYSRVKNAHTSKQLSVKCSVRTFCGGTEDNGMVYWY